MLFRPLQAEQANGPPTLGGYCFPMVRILRSKWMLALSYCISHSFLSNASISGFKTTCSQLLSSRVERVVTNDVEEKVNPNRLRPQQSATMCSTIPHTYYSYYYFHLLQWFNFISSLIRLTDYPVRHHTHKSFKEACALISQRYCGDRSRVRSTKGKSDRNGKEEKIWLKTEEKGDDELDGKWGPHTHRILKKTDVKLNPFHTWDG